MTKWNAWHIAGVRNNNIHQTTKSERIDSPINIMPVNTNNRHDVFSVYINCCRYYLYEPVTS